jgi:hypothetical protein
MGYCPSVGPSQARQHLEEVLLTDWTQVGSLATGIGALVNAAVGGLIAWQAWETRQTAQAGREGVEVSRRSLAISQAMAIDSTKARLDARAPRLLVTPAPTDSETVKGASNFGEDQPWPLEQREL